MSDHHAPTRLGRGAFALLLAVLPSFALSPQVLLSIDGGGGVSFADVEPPTNVEIGEPDSRFFGHLGGGLEVRLNEYFGAFAGVQYEKRSLRVEGDDAILGWFRGEDEFTYSHVEVPILLRGIVPLMVPGNVVISLGPRFGFYNDGREVLTANFPNWDRSLDTLVNATEVALAGSIAYEIPINWVARATVYVGYAHGLTDIYENSDPNWEWDIRNRDLFFGLSLYATIVNARRK